MPVFEVGCDADVYFIAMGLIEGESLAELRNRGASPLGVAGPWRSSPTWPRLWPTPTNKGSCTGTSNP